MQRAAITIVEYLLGFFALAVFAAYAFGAGAASTERLIAAFKLGSGLAAIELLVLFSRKVPTNRLILGANIWLIFGGFAAFTQQWWYLRIYEHLGEASLFAIMFAVGLVATAATPGGFVAAAGTKRKIILASLALLVAVVGAFILAIAYKGNVKIAAIFPVIGLSWLNRGLKLYAESGA